MSGLASAVAKAGGIGVIAAVGLGFGMPELQADPVRTNLLALQEQIRLAKQKAAGGIIGVNVMVALREFDEAVRTSIASGADIIFSGAGLPMDLPALVEGSKALIAPIISSAKAAAVICKGWNKRFNRVPDAIVLEGPLAGGHLGFTVEELSNSDEGTLKRLLVEVLEAIAPYTEKQAIPVIAGGGVWSGVDIFNLFKSGAHGVQMATRFVTTHECDASDGFKQAYLDAQQADDLMIIRSPLGLPGRAIRNNFLARVSQGETIPNYCNYICLKTCKPSEAPYCIANVLINAREGRFEEGFAFAGANAWRCDRIISVQELMDRLQAEYEAAAREEEG